MRGRQAIVPTSEFLGSAIYNIASIKSTPVSFEFSITAMPRIDVSIELQPTSLHYVQRVVKRCLLQSLYQLFLFEP